MCNNCNGFDTLSWRQPAQSEVAMPAGTEMLPMIVGAQEPERDVIDVTSGSDATVLVDAEVIEETTSDIDASEVKK